MIIFVELTLIYFATHYNRFIMSVVLNTQLGSLMITSQIPDIDLTTSDTNEAVVKVATSGIDYWIYGHSHRNIDQTIGTTRYLCNQFGYVSHNEHLPFNRAKVIDV